MRSSKTAVIAIMVLVVLAGMYVATATNTHPTTSPGGEGVIQAGGEAKLYLMRLSHPDLEIDENSEPSISKVKLVTGDEILVMEKDGEVRYAFLTKTHEKIYSILRTRRGDVYVFPNNIDVSKFSPELFNLRTLYHYQVELGLKSLPLIVKLKPGIMVGEENTDGALALIKDFPHLDLHIINSVALRIPLDRIQVFFQEAVSSDAIEKVTLDHVRHISSGASPMLYRSVPWIGGKYAWSKGLNGTGVKIAILDTGIDPSHPDFYVNDHTKIIGMKSFVDFDFNNVPDESVQDLHGHGTHVAGIAAGTGAYLENITGVAPGAELLVGKVLSNEGYGYDSWIIEGIEWAVNNTADIISMSLGGTSLPVYDPLVEAVDKAVEEGALVVVAAGNEGPDFFTIDSPGVSSKALTVGAVYTYDGITYFSSRGPTSNGTLKPDVVAPGYDIVSAKASNTLMGLPASLKHVAASGTSMATPHVSGAAAIFLEALENTFGVDTIASTLNVSRGELLKDVIVSTSIDYWGDPLSYGAGLVNITYFLELLEHQSLLFIHPARAELGLDKPNVTITVYNPWDTDASFMLYGAVFYGNVTGNTPSPPPPGAFTYPSGVITVPAHGSYSFNVSINTTMLSRLDTYALELFLLNTTTSQPIEKILIGINTFRPLGTNPHSYVTLNITYNGIPVQAEAIAGYYTDASTGYPWFHEIYASGTGNVTLGPLFENSVYYFIVNSPLNATEIGLNTNEAYASIHLAVAVPDTPTNTTVDIDLAAYPQSVIEIPENIYASGGGYYYSLIAYNGEVTDYWYSLFELEAIGRYNYTLIEGIDAIGDPSILSNTMLIPYNAGIDFEAQDLNETIFIGPDSIAFNPAAPVKRYIRTFDWSILPDRITIEPSNVNYTIINTRAVITKNPVPVASYTVHFTSGLQFSFPSYIYGRTGSIVVYQVDTNDDYDITGGFAIVDIESMGKVLEIQGSDTFGTNEGSDTYVFDPLLMPKGITVWTLLYGYPGLDDYNYTGAITQAHIFRETFFGSFAMSETTGEPVFSLKTILNNNYTSIVESSSPIIGDTPWYYTPENLEHPSQTIELSANLSLFSDQLSFLSQETYMRLNINTTADYSPSNFLSYAYIGYNYGLGVRDIVPISGYNKLLNMIPPDTDAIFAVLFNIPSQGNISTTSTHIYIEGPGNTLIPAPILEWDFNTLPDAIAYILIPATIMDKGVYGMLVEGNYYDAANDTISFTLEVKPAFYIGVPPGTPQLSLLKENILGENLEPLTEVTPGEAVTVDLTFEPGSLAYMPSIMEGVTPENANVTVTLFSVAGPLESITLPFNNRTGEALEAKLMVPWGTPEFTIGVEIVSEKYGLLYNTTYSGG